MARITLRPVDHHTDFPRMAELYNLFAPDPLTAEDLQRWLDNASPERIHHRAAALDEQGQLIGFNNTGRDPWDAPGRFWMEVVVDPAFHKQGIGSQLYAEALGFVQAQGATCLAGEVRDNLPDSLQFVQQSGFQIDRHQFESTLTVSTFEEERFTGVIENHEASGIRFFSLADLGNSREEQYKLYEINRLCSTDIPGNQDTFPPFEQFQKNVCEASWYRADGQIIAAEGERWIGMSAVGYFSLTNSMYNMMTGVLPAYRGRKIALALKLLTIRFARTCGADYIRTNNDSENAPMLAVNRKLGYQPSPGKYLVLRQLES